VCGGPNPDGATFCATCGRALGSRSVDGDLPDPAPALVASAPVINTPVGPEPEVSAHGVHTPFVPEATASAPPPPPAPVNAAGAGWRPVYPCLVCGATLGYFDFFCKRCRTPRGRILDPYAESPGNYLPGTALFDPPGPRLEQRRSNDSGLGKPAPAEIARGWNWGAFWLPFFWGMSHRTYQTLLVFGLALATLCVDGVLFTSKSNMLPQIGFASALLWLAGIPLSIWYGARGNEWAWQNRTFQSVDEFRSIQKVWATWAVVIFVVIALGSATVVAAIWIQTLTPA